MIEIVDVDNFLIARHFFSSMGLPFKVFTRDWKWMRLKSFFSSSIFTTSIISGLVLFNKFNSSASYDHD